jgi:small subunit ribosomal protein S6
MAAQPPLYDLVLLLDPAQEEDVRTRIITEAEGAITAQGELVGAHDWGEREMAFEINHQSRAHYRLVQFHGPPALVAHLQRTLRVTDGIIRFRIVKLDPGTPAPPTQQPAFTPEAPADAEADEAELPIER